MKIVGKIIIALGAICIAALATFSAHAYPDSWQPAAAIEGNSEVKLNQKIVVNFSFPVLISDVEKNLAIFPEADVNFSWSDSNKKLTIIPKTHWQPETKYTVTINDGKSIFFASFNSDISFFTERKPMVESIVPISGEKNVAVDIEDPIVVIFNKPLNDYSVKFVVSPDQKLSYEMSGDKKTIRLLASDDFMFSTQYNIQVYLKYKGDDQDAYRKVGETTFSTIAPPPPLVIDWSKDLEERVNQAKQYTTAQLTSGKYIDVNLKQQVMVLFENAAVIDAYVVSSGKRGMETPTGNFQIHNKAPRPWSKQYSLFMPNWMAIVDSGKYGIHELPEWPGGYKEGANHLGTPVSHGCVRLGVGAAKRVYDWAEIGTPVVIHY
jgi:lipoprotein-anchoring transpeptidase ErfK/SrfK